MFKPEHAQAAVGGLPCWMGQEAGHSEEPVFSGSYSLLARGSRFGPLACEYRRSSPSASCADCRSAEQRSHGRYSPQVPLLVPLMLICLPPRQRAKAKGSSLLICVQCSAASRAACNRTRGGRRGCAADPGSPRHDRRRSGGSGGQQSCAGRRRAAARWRDAGVRLGRDPPNRAVVPVVSTARSCSDCCARL